MARLVGVSPSVIRSWESLGLTRPHRTASKYRLYAPEDVRLLKRARFLRRVRGLNAPAIVQLLKRDGLVTISRQRRRDDRAPGSGSCVQSEDSALPQSRKRWASRLDF